MKQCHWTLYLVPIAAAIQVVMLAAGFLVLRAGTGSLNNENHLPRGSGYYVALIDTSQYTVKVGGETYHGLPDSHDFSRTEDIFAIYPALYCSAKKNGEKYEAQYCSTWGRQFFDLQRLWRVWGVDLIQHKVIGSTPKLLFIGVMTTVTANTLSLGFSLLAICFYWSVIVATIFCTVTTISALATTIVSHMFVSKLVTTTANLKTSGTGKLTTEWGHLYSRTAWAYCGFSFTALLILFFILWGQRRERHKQFRTESQSGEKVPFVGVIRRATGDLFQRGRKARYVNVEADEFAVASSRNASQENLMPRSRQTSGAHSHTPSRDGSRSRSRGRSPVGEVPSERGVVLETETAYEPMRHRTLPE